MAVKYGSGPRPAAQSAKRCFLNCLETSSQAFHSLAFLHCQQSSAQRTVSQSQNTMAVKYGSGPQPVAHSAKRGFLNCLETSHRPSIRLPSCTARRAPLKGRSRKHQTPVAVTDRIGPAAGSPECQTLLSELPRITSSQTFHLPHLLASSCSCLSVLHKLRSKDPPAGLKTPGQ